MIVDADGHALVCASYMCELGVAEAEAGAGVSFAIRAARRLVASLARCSSLALCRMGRISPPEAADTRTINLSVKDTINPWRTGMCPPPRHRVRVWIIFCEQYCG